MTTFTIHLASGLRNNCVELILIKKIYKVNKIFNGPPIVQYNLNTVLFKLLIIFKIYCAFQVTTDD